MAGLEQARYHLEAAVLMRMSGQESASHKMMARFQRRRSDIVRELNPAQVAQFNDLSIESTLREKIESEMPWSLDLIARSGVLPL